ncbi:MAG: hypothetical protein QXJ07_06115 [Candidatus Bathyarchaeia archaeon]
MRKRAINELDPKTWTQEVFARKIGKTQEWVSQIITAYKSLIKLRSITEVGVQPFFDGRAGVYGTPYLYSCWCPAVPLPHLSQRPVYMSRFLIITSMLVSQEKLEEAFRLLDEGKTSFRDLESKLGVPKSTLQR